MHMGNCSFMSRAGQYPKLERIVKDTMAYPSVAKYLETNRDLFADPFKIMPEEYHTAASEGKL